MLHQFHNIHVYAHTHIHTGGSSLWVISDRQHNVVTHMQSVGNSTTHYHIVTYMTLYSHCTTVLLYIVTNYASSGAQHSCKHIHIPTHTHTHTYTAPVCVPPLDGYVGEVHSTAPACAHTHTHYYTHACTAMPSCRQQRQ